MTMSGFSVSLRNSSDATRSFANRHRSSTGFSSSRYALCIVAGQCLSVRITLVRSTDSFRLSWRSSSDTVAGAAFRSITA
jgi:hypothetical protein